MKISVIMSAYNTADYISRAIESVLLSETKHDIELIVVDDCSTDETRAIVEEYERTNNNVLLLKHKKNMGAGQSRRDGINAASGDYIITIDSDDTITPDFLERLASTAEQTGADIVSGCVNVIHADGTISTDLYHASVFNGYEACVEMSKRKVQFMNDKLIRRTLAIEVPYCNRRFIEDTPTIIPILFLAHKVAFVPVAGYNYYQRSHSLCHSTPPAVYALFRGLATLDGIEFFTKRAPWMVKEFDLLGALAGHINELYAERLDNEFFSKYANEFATLFAKANPLVNLKATPAKINQ